MRNTIVTFKDGNLPSVQDEVRILKEITPDNSCDQTQVIKKNRICDEYTWINEIEYKGFLVNWEEFQKLLKGKVTIRHLCFVLIGYLIFAQIDESAIEKLSTRRIQVRFV